LDDNTGMMMQTYNYHISKGKGIPVYHASQDGTNDVPACTKAHQNYWLNSNRHRQNHPKQMTNQDPVSIRCDSNQRHITRSYRSNKSTMWHKKLQHKHKSASLEFGTCMSNTDHTKMEKF
jgi:hypothetical protein